MFRRKNFISTLLNILGMTAAFAAFYVILVQVYHDFSYNKKLKEHKRICLVSIPSWFNDGKYMSYFCRPIMEELIKNMAGIESGGTDAYNRQVCDVFLPSKEGSDDYSRPMKSTYANVSDGFLDVFDITFVKGSFEDVLPNSNHVAISESEAKRLGLDVGSTFMSRYNGGSKHPREVRAIYKDMPANTLFDDYKILFNISEENLDNSSEWSYQYYLKLSEGASMEEVEKAAADYLADYFKRIYPKASSEELEESINRTRPHFVPLADVYFDQNLTHNGKKGNKTTTLTLLIVAALVIIIAFINYINFFIAMVPVRIKGINTKKILGSSRAGIVGRFVVESLGMVSVSLVLAAVLVILFKDSSLISPISCTISFGSNIGVAIATILIALLISVAASIYPALYITSFNPAMVIRGSFGASAGGKKLRYALIGLQFVISTGLIVCALFINLQRDYMLKHDMGFKHENLLVARVSWNIANHHHESLDNTLRASPLVKDITWADGDIVADTRMVWGRDYDGVNITFHCYPVAWNFPKVMGLEIIEGRDFTQADELSQDGTFIFNRAAKEKFALTLEHKISGHKGPTDIAGFCEDFNFRTLQNKVEPFALYIFGSSKWRALNTIFIRTQEGAPIGEVMQLMRNSIAALNPETPADEISVNIFDEQLEQMYYKEKNLSKLITLFTMLAIIISLMGVFGLVMFETEYRRKEIGIRRVNGASVGEILAMFNRKFLRILPVCFVIALPLSWFIMDAYLDGFAYRVPLYAWVFLLAMLAVLAITLSVVTLRSYRTATQNPVEALRNE